MQLLPPGLGALPGVADLLNALFVDCAVLAKGVGGLVRLHDHRPEQIFLIAGDVQVVLQLQDKSIQSRQIIHAQVEHSVVGQHELLLLASVRPDTT